MKEVFTNADGSVQFVEMFDSFGGEIFTSGFTLTANSDGNIKTFTFPSNISSTPGSMLIATTGFGSLPGGVTPDFTFSQGGVSGTFFNPNATNLTFTFQRLRRLDVIYGRFASQERDQFADRCRRRGISARHTEYQLRRQFADKSRRQLRLGEPGRARADCWGAATDGSASNLDATATLLAAIIRILIAIVSRYRRLRLQCAPKFRRYEIMT